MAARGLTPGDQASMRPMHEGIVERLAAEAIRRGADLLDVEYQDGYEHVVAAKGGVAITPLFSRKAEGYRGQRKGESFPEGKILLALESG